MRHNPNASCAMCAAPFYSPPGRPQRTCSAKCRGVSQRGMIRQPVERTCEICSIVFAVPSYRVKPGEARFCGKACKGEATRRRRTVDLTTRFWRHVDKSGACWVWTGAHNKQGYGAIALYHTRPTFRAAPAHRVSWELHFGPISDGLWVLHRCDNPPCVRPDHLFLGTPQDNIDDMRAKGRARYPGLPTGERHPRAKLTDSQAAQIRARHAAGEISHAALAREFGVGRWVVTRIISGGGYPV